MQAVIRGPKCVSLAPTVTPNSKSHALRDYSVLVAIGHEKRLATKKKDLLEDSAQEASISESSPLFKDNILPYIETLHSNKFDDLSAMDMFHPVKISPLPVGVVMEMLIHRFKTTVKEVPWNKEEKAVEWVDDLRFLGDWWLTLLPVESPVRKAALQALQLDEKDAYSPHLSSSDSLNVNKVNEYVARLAARSHGSLYEFGTLHINNLLFTPSRMHVLLFGGFIARATKEASEGIVKEEELSITTAQSISGCVTSAEDGQALPHSLRKAPPTTVLNLETISFPFCGISNAALVVLLAGINAFELSGVTIINLDLAHNKLGGESLRILTSLLPLTKVRRLSLRGNHLGMENVNSFRDFLYDGCISLQELDLSYTYLTAKQLGILLDTLPSMFRLQTLLLRGHIFSTSMVVSLVKIGMMKQILLRIDESYENHRASVNALRPPLRPLINRHKSFFEQLYALASQKVFSNYSGALPEGYHCFHSNDPSLPGNLYYNIPVNHP